MKQPRTPAFLLSRISLVNFRSPTRLSRGLCALVWIAAAAMAGQPGRCQAVTFEVSLNDEFANRPITGRLYIFLSTQNAIEPRNGPNWFTPEPFFRVDVTDFRAGESRMVDDRAAGFPAPLNELPAGAYFAQAVLDFQKDSQRHGRAAGNLYSTATKVVVNGSTAATKFQLELDNVVPADPFPMVGWLREIVRRSEILSKYHGREVPEFAGIVLPESYTRDPSRRYPVVYSVPGFGGTHREALKHARAPPKAEAGEVEFIRVMLSGNCEWGHHCYADSETNGPRGQALVEEMIPYIDRTFRTIASPDARFLTGHSSGGWSSLWLQVSYPGTFGGVWSTAPDPVDFREFQRINLYADAPTNMYVDERGKRRPIARRGLKPALWYDDFTRMDDVLERGGQLRSFEAVFSPKGVDGEPLRMWDRETGEVNPRVVDAWKKYDINLKLEENWSTLGPKLEGKLHVIVGDRDNFYLEGATRKLAATLSQLGSDAEVTIVPDRDHANLMTPELYARIRREMSQSFRTRAPAE
jgi:hypothetical protein